MFIKTSLNPCNNRFISNRENRTKNFFAEILFGTFCAPTHSSHASTHSVSSQLFVCLLWLDGKQLTRKLTSINKTTWLFVFVVDRLSCWHSTFGVQAGKSTRLIKLGPLQPLVCVRPVFSSEISYCFVCLLIWMCLCFSLSKANALSTLFLTSQLLLWYPFSGVQLINQTMPSMNTMIFRRTIEWLGLFRALFITMRQPQDCYNQPAPSVRSLFSRH